ncbi:MULTISPECIES: CGNR zinc finger domain-containing protein [unclassified Streptomyces]|uniref:CGNR zinc finger domain-containing protein n=1 Tax=unclassified Streptomyces TaxID=2593676 RepID=UPI00278C063D|nr:MULTISPECIES: CGNR zinc finger domain-containing protein [unclassified Streptomyces]
MSAAYPDFRLGKVLATSFTGTLSERHGDPVERIPVPDRLMDWLAVYGLAVDSCTLAQLELARELRESIHAAATAAAAHEPLPGPAVRTINEFSAHGRAAAVLTTGGERRWRLGANPAAASVEDALSVIAADAVDVIAGERDGKLALCASPTCRAAFFDTSQSRTRRWCDMNTCGNRQKKARFQANQRKTSSKTSSKTSRTAK